MSEKIEIDPKWDYPGAHLDKDYPYTPVYDIHLDPKQEKVCKDASEDRRRMCLDLAHRYGNFEPQRVDDVIEDAIKIENYLAGKLEAPNAYESPSAAMRAAVDYVKSKYGDKCKCPGGVVCGDCEGVVRDDL